MKICNGCSTNKSLDEFAINRSKKDGHSSTCKSCSREIQARYYKKNPSYYKRKSREQHRLIQETVREIKSTNPCKDCGKIFPYYCMDFDHLRDKEFCISMHGRRTSLNKILLEIAKCDLVCAVCHRIRTFKRMLNGAG